MWIRYYGPHGNISMKLEDIERESLEKMLLGKIRWEIDQDKCEHQWSDTYKEWVSDSTVYKRCSVCGLRHIVSSAFD